MIGCVIRLATDRGIAFHMSARAVERKLRLFYCACCRLRWDPLPPAAQSVVALVEGYVEGGVSAQRLRTERNIARVVGSPVPSSEASRAVQLARVATEVHVPSRRGGFVDSALGSPVDQVRLLRELFENPFHPSAIPDSWLTPTVVTLARVIRTERAFDLMPVLGDALQDGGCTHTNILEHCYGPGPHFAGCWLVDRLSGRGAS
jgi:hypothetical protein